MQLLIHLIERFEKLEDYKASVEESWGFFTIKGEYDEGVFEHLEAVVELLIAESCWNVCTLMLDSEKIEDKDDLELFMGTQSFKTFSVTLKKEALVEQRSGPSATTFFWTEANCLNWLNKLNPLSQENPLNKFAPINIIIKGLSLSFGGQYLYFVPPDIQYASKIHNNPFVLPTLDKVKESVHFVTSDNIGFNPNAYIITEGDYSSALAALLLKQSSFVMSVCLVNEFYSAEQVVLDGLKRTTLKLADRAVVCSYLFNQQLASIVSWMYEDRVTTRKKLFNERLTLELNPANTLLSSLEEFGLAAFEQAKERFNFVILDRKDAYLKELKDLLKDLRGQSDLYSTKIRTLLNNFLRDVLAAIVLIGFTIFTKFTDNLALNKHDLLDKVFTGLGIYYLVSIAFQAIIDWADIGVTNKELKYWKKVTKELIPDREFEKHLKDSLQGRRCSLKILYPLIAILYIAIAIACFCYASYFSTLIDTASAAVPQR